MKTPEISPRLLAAAIIAVGSPSLLHADHGRDFLLVQDYHVPGQWHGNVLAGFEWNDVGDDEEFGVEPGVVLGLMPRVSFSLSTHFSGSTFDEMDYASVTPAVQVQLTPPDWEFPVRVAVMADYEFAGDEGGGHSHATAGSHSHAVPEKPMVKSRAAKPVAAATSFKPAAIPVVMAPVPAPAPAIDLGPDAPPPDAGGGTGPSGHDHSSHDHPSHSHASGNPATGHAHEAGHAANESLSEDAVEHEHSGIHAHGTSGFRARLIVEGDLTDSTKLVANLINVIPEDGDTAWGYAVGLRHSFNHDFAVGLEAMGDFESDGWHECLGGVYWSPIHPLMLKLGVGTGLTSQSPDVSVRAGVVWRF